VGLARSCFKVGGRNGMWVAGRPATIFFSNRQRYIYWFCKGLEDFSIGCTTSVASTVVLSYFAWASKIFQLAALPLLLLIVKVCSYWLYSYRISIYVLFWLTTVKSKSTQPVMTMKSCSGLREMMQQTIVCLRRRAGWIHFHSLDSIMNRSPPQPPPPQLINPPPIFKPPCVVFPQDGPIWIATSAWRHCFAAPLW